MDFRPSSLFLLGLDGLMMSMADLLSLLVWVLLRGVCSVRHAGPLSEPAAVFMIPPYLVLWDIINTKARKRYTLGVIEREGENELIACLLVFVKTTSWS